MTWPRHETGALKLDEDTFKMMASAYPILRPLQELRHALSGLRLNDLAVGGDGRNRTVLWAFKSKTGRNQPSNSQFIFGPAVWLRGLLKPSQGQAIAYIDYEQQEFGIGGALSGDAKMLDAYSSGDPYMAFAIQVGAAPRGATKGSHGEIRDRFKECVLAVQYGMGEHSLAHAICDTPQAARMLLDMHHRT